MKSILNTINSPKDLKGLSRPQRRQLCGEIRETLIRRLGATGGHVGSNLAMVEMTVAIHIVFDSPRDQIVFDVSHQLSMLAWSLEQTEGPVVIRVPGVATASRKAQLLPAYAHPAKYELAEAGSRVAILALGKLFPLGQAVRARLKERCGIEATLVNPRYLSGVDCEILEGLRDAHRCVVILEDGVLDGGFGEKIARYYHS